MSPRPSHRGLSLLEILLVLALLVILGALVAPAIGRFAESQQLRDSATLIRGKWARARVQAMKSGRIHVFRYEQEGAHFIVDFWIAEDDELEAGDDSEVASSSADVPWGAEELPDGVRFLLGETEGAALEEQVAADLDSSPAAGDVGVWSAPILFYSDGTTSSAEIVLANERGRAIRLSLRGLTGIGTVSDVFSIQPDAGGDAP